ncbi:MAG: hypothetical protein L0J35_06510, partial [Tetragenococcus halophilus]|nr:hypothetical protein [Tetragenococcus halophilus]
RKNPLIIFKQYFQQLIFPVGKIQVIHLQYKIKRKDSALLLKSDNYLENFTVAAYKEVALSFHKTKI